MTILPHNSADTAPDTTEDAAPNLALFREQVRQFVADANNLRSSPFDGLVVLAKRQGLLGDDSVQPNATGDRHGVRPGTDNPIKSLRRNDPALTRAVVPQGFRTVT